MNRACCLLAMAICTLAGAGCAQFQEYANENIIASRNKKMALEAWRSVENAYPIGKPYRKHFKDGFIDGYYDVASGGDGCPPVLPPPKYWEACYQSPEGHEKIRMWFNGFSEGVMVAKLDGAGTWSQIPISLNANCEYPEGMEPGAEVPPPPGEGVTPPIAPRDVPRPLPPAPTGTPKAPVKPPVPPRIPQELREEAEKAAPNAGSAAKGGKPKASPVILPVAH